MNQCEETTALKHRRKRTILTSLSAWLATANRLKLPMSGSEYMHTSIASPGFAANYHTGNGQDHLCIVECPNAHIFFLSWCSMLFTLTHNSTRDWDSSTELWQSIADRIWTCAGNAHRIRNPMTLECSSCVELHMNYTQVQNFDMVLQTGYDLAGWESIFIEAGISATSAKIYAQTFSSKEITRDSLHMLDCMMLKELGIKTMGDVLTILKLTKEPLVSPASHMKPPTVKLPSSWKWQHNNPGNSE